MATKAAADPAGGLKLTLDFTGLSDRERSTHFEPSDVLFKIEALTPRIKKGDERKPTASQTRMIEMQVRAVATSYGGDIGGVLYENLMTFIPGKEPRLYLWKIRNLLKAVSDKPIPTSSMQVDLSTIVGRTFMGTVIDGDPWERTDEETGKTTSFETSQINNFNKASTYTAAYGAPGTAAARVAPKAAADDDEGDGTVYPDGTESSTEGDDEDDNVLPALEVTDL
jgi:hypothetical protein